jgi:hypothetical protein
MAKPTSVNQRDHGRYAAGLFAATVVLTCGFGVCLTITFLFEPDAWWPLVVIGGGLVALVATLWLFSDSPIRRARDSNLFAARKEQVDEYVESFRPRHRRRQRLELGTKQPPTADDLRQIKEDSNCWYPSDRRVEEYRRNLNPETKRLDRETNGEG